jgi:hypothetical protein
VANEKPEPKQKTQPKQGEPDRSAYAITWSYFGFLDGIIQGSTREAEKRLAEVKKRLRREP